MFEILIQRREKINIYNQLINYSQNINDYYSLVENLEKLYDVLEDDREKERKVDSIGIS